MLGGLALELIGHLQEQPTEKAGIPTGNDQTLAKALVFLRGNSHRPITVNDVARAVAVSRRTLERRFQEEKGMSVVVALRDFRMERAKSLLLDSHLPSVVVNPRAGIGASRAGRGGFPSNNPTPRNNPC